MTDIRAARTAINSSDGRNRVFELMRENDPSIPTQNDADDKSDECTSASIRRGKEFKNAGFLKRIWLGLKYWGEDDQMLAKFTACQAKRKKIAGMHDIAWSIARNAVAVVDKTDVGCLSPEELDEAASYAISEFKRFRSETLPKIKEASIADSPLFKLANEIDKESDKIEQENWLKENNPEYLEYLEEGER